MQNDCFIKNGNHLNNYQTLYVDQLAQEFYCDFSFTHYFRGNCVMYLVASCENSTPHPIQHIVRECVCMGCEWVGVYYTLGMSVFLLLACAALNINKLRFVKCVWIYQDQVDLSMAIPNSAVILPKLSISFRYIAKTEWVMSLNLNSSNLA